MTDDKKPGPTGKHPQGKIREDDDGEIAIAIGVHEDKIIVDFGTPTKWIGFGKEEAIALANMLIKKANEI